MAYTDTSLESVAIKKIHVSELADGITILATGVKKASLVDVSGLDYTKINSANIAKLQKAIHALESSFSNNCCQADCCQTCQGCQSCQKCQSCQGCQTKTCQSSSCQKCQTCQRCQSYSCQGCQSCQKP